MMMPCSQRARFVAWPSPSCTDIVDSDLPSCKTLAFRFLLGRSRSLRSESSDGVARRLAASRSSDCSRSSMRVRCLGPCATIQAWLSACAGVIRAWGSYSRRQRMKSTPETGE